jgi:hypothetical protein
VESKALIISTRKQAAAISSAPPPPLPPPPAYLVDDDAVLDPLPAHMLSYSSLRRSLLRWHVANLEYGCAKSVQDVSLQQWDQDDPHNSHDQGGHDFMPYGYDTFVRGMLQVCVRVCVGVPRPRTL